MGVDCSFCCLLRECLVSVNTYKSYAPLCCLFISSTCMTFPHVWGIRYVTKNIFLNSFGHGEILWGLNLMCVLRWWNCLSVLSQVELDQCPNLGGRIFFSGFSFWIRNSHIVYISTLGLLKRLSVPNMCTDSFSFFLYFSILYILLSWFHSTGEWSHFCLYVSVHYNGLC